MALNGTITSGSIVFTANESHYYVLTKKAETAPTPGSNHPQSPTTGDNGHNGAWIATLILSATVLLWFVFGKRKENENRD